MCTQRAQPTDLLQARGRPVSVTIEMASCSGQPGEEEPGQQDVVPARLTNVSNRLPRPRGQWCRLDQADATMADWGMGAVPGRLRTEEGGHGHTDQHQPQNGVRHETLREPRCRPVRRRAHQCPGL